MNARFLVKYAVDWLLTPFTAHGRRMHRRFFVDGQGLGWGGAILMTVSIPFTYVVMAFNNLFVALWSMWGLIPAIALAGVFYACVRLKLNHRGPWHESDS